MCLPSLSTIFRNVVPKWHYILEDITWNNEAFTPNTLFELHRSLLIAPIPEQKQMINK